MRSSPLFVFGLVVVLCYFASDVNGSKKFKNKKTLPQKTIKSKFYNFFPFYLSYIPIFQAVKLYYFVRVLLFQVFYNTLGDMKSSFKIIIYFIGQS